MAISAVADTSPLYTDLRDIAKYNPKLLPDASVIVHAVQADAELFIPEGTQDVTIYGTFALQELPKTSGSLTSYENVTAFMSSKSKGYFVRRYSISIQDNNGTRSVEKVNILHDIPVTSLHFQVDVGLVPRIAVLQDVQNGITMTYPIGVGGVDPGVANQAHVTKLLTPLFTNATLHRRSVVPHRTDPTYYRGEPFMPITNARGVQTPIGFHITILSDPDWKNKGANYLVRGFDSHGCMRFRGRDLHELFAIVMQGGSEALPVSVNYFVYNRGADGYRGRQNGLFPTIGAYPIFSRYYQSVKNIAPPGQPPMPHRDPKEHLLDLNPVTSSPIPVLMKLNGFTEEDRQDLSTFDRMEKEVEALAPPSVPSLAKAKKLP